jgi:hypothetical protein
MLAVRASFFPSLPSYVGVLDRAGVFTLGAPAFFVPAVLYLDVHAHLLRKRMLVVAGLECYRSLIRHGPARPSFVPTYSDEGAGLREIARPKLSSARRAASTLSCTGPAVLHRGQCAEYPLSVRLTSGVKKAPGCSHDSGGVASMLMGPFYSRSLRLLHIRNLVRNGGVRRDEGTGPFAHSSRSSTEVCSPSPKSVSAFRAASAPSFGGPSVPHSGHRATCPRSVTLTSSEAKALTW